MIVHIREGSKEYTPEERLLRPQSIAEVKVQEIIDLAENFTKERHLQFIDRMLEVGKRNDKTFGTVPVLPTMSYTPFEVDPNMPPEYQDYIKQQMAAYQHKIKEIQERQYQAYLQQMKQQQEAIAKADAEADAKAEASRKQEAEKAKEVASPQKGNSNKKGNQDEFELDYPVKVVQTYVKPEAKVSLQKEKEDEDANKGAVVVEQPDKSESTEKIEKSEHSELSVEKVENNEKEGEDFQVHEDRANEKEDQ